MEFTTSTGSGEPDPQMKIPLPCHIRQSDINAMDYWLNDCPMSDIATENAVCIALNRLLKPGMRLRVRLNHENAAIASIDGRDIELGTDLGHWLANALSGYDMEPATYWVRLPWSALSRKVQAAHLRFLFRLAIPAQASPNAA